MRKTIKLLFAGDIFISNSDECPDFSKQLKRIIKDHDIACVNLEAPILDIVDNVKEASGYGVKLFQNASGVAKLREEGINLFALANNHIMNYGVEGLRSTLDVLKQDYIMGAGMTYEEAYRPFVFMKNGLKIGILNAAERQYGVAEQYQGYGHAWINSDRFSFQLKKMVETCDKVIVVCHAGMENVEIPLPEWRRIYRQLIDDGVDVVIGHHPHVIQGWENYKGGTIFYSLGNFVWKSEAVKSSQAASMVVSVEIDEKCEVKTNIIPIICKEDVDVLEDDSFDIYLNEIVELLNKEDEYQKRVDQVCVAEYEQGYIKSIYGLLGLCPPTRFRNKIINLLLIALGKVKVDQEFLYIWGANETLQWTITRATICKKILKE